MIDNMQEEKPEVYQCPVCGLHYEKQELARECEAWCSEHKSCKVEITEQSIEAKAQRDKSN